MGEPQPSTSATLPTESKPQGRAFKKNLPRDFTLVLKGSYKVPVSSEVLCWNSPVFTKIIQDLNVTSHEMDDFEYEAVECFIQCLYTGKSKSLSANIFRECYEMANMFAVSWLICKCIQFFEDKARKEYNDMENLHFLISEADYAFETRKDSRLIDLFKSLSSEIFFPTESIGQIVPSNEDLNDISSTSLELLKVVAGNEVEILARLVEGCVRESKSMTENVKLLLDPVLLARCLINDSGTYFSLFQTLQSLETLSLEDMKFIAKIQLESTLKVSQIAIVKHITAVDLKIPDPICCRSNYYFSQKLKEISSYSKLIKLFRETSTVKNLYQFIDGMIFWMYFHAESKELPNWSNDVEHEIVTIRIEQRWRKVSDEYLITKQFPTKAMDDFFSSLLKCSNLVCKRKYPLIADKCVSVLKLFKQSHVFHFIPPKQINLGNKASVSRISIKSRSSNARYRSDSPNVLFEFIPNDVDGFKSISSSSETIYPQQMHLCFAVTGKAKSGPNQFVNWEPMPPLTWASGLHCYHHGERFHLCWREIDFKESEIPAVDETFEGNFKIQCRLYY